MVVRRNHVPRQDPVGPVGGGRQRQGRLRRPRDEQVGLRFLDDLLDVDHANRDGAVRTRLDAGRGFALRQPIAAHVALADDPFGVAVLRRVVRTGQRAVLAPEALVVEMLDDARHRILLIGVDGARVHAGRVEAVVTRGRDMLHHGQALASAVQQPHVAPRFLLLEAVQRMARRDARLAAGAGVQVHVEGVLLAGGRRRRRHERRIASGQGEAIGLRLVVRLREARGGRFLLLQEQAIDQRGQCGSAHGLPTPAPSRSPR